MQTIIKAGTPKKSATPETAESTSNPVTTSSGSNCSNTLGSGEKLALRTPSRKSYLPVVPSPLLQGI